ncbi:claudin-7-A-like [Oreochromis aureus]|uniref:claudin-7-A-like n=1 Tax=Oreochromis aureus TaxID=47969 RepID=UPI00195401FB|nr:claudin-7-A-like [Oreochromis aureus]
MADCKLLGLFLAIIGFLGSIITCVLPMWRVTPFIRSKIVTAQAIHEGLWVSCVVQSTSQKQCKGYDSMLALPQELQASRALIIITILLGFFGILFGVVGIPTTQVLRGGSWDHRFTIGWGSAGLLFLGGGLLCSFRPRMNDNDFLEATEFEGRPQKMREIRATVADLTWQGRTYLGRLVGEQTLLSVEKRMKQQIQAPECKSPRRTIGGATVSPSVEELSRAPSRGHPAATEQKPQGSAPPGPGTTTPRGGNTPRSRRCYPFPRGGDSPGLAVEGRPRIPDNRTANSSSPPLCPNG